MVPKRKKFRTEAQRAWREQSSWERYEKRFYAAFSLPMALSPRCFAGQSRPASNTPRE
jgi:hypothetical protein